MENSSNFQAEVTPLTSDQENLMREEMRKNKEKLDSLLQELGSNLDEFDDLVVFVNEIEQNPDEADETIIQNVRQAQRCLNDNKEIERWLNEGLRQEDFLNELFQSFGISTNVIIDEEYRQKMQKANEKHQDYYLQMYLRGHKSFQRNQLTLFKCQYDVDKAIKASQPSELEKLTADLQARLKKIGTTAIKTVQEELEIMQKQSRDPNNKRKRQIAEDAIPALTEILKVYSKICEISKINLVNQHKLQVTTLEDVEEELTTECEELDRLQRKGIMGRVTEREKRVSILQQLKALLLEKKVTDKILEGPVEEPFYNQPNWKQEIYPKQPYEKRVEMLDKLLQQNQLADYSELLAAEAEIQESDEYKTLIMQVKLKISSSQWEIVSSLLYQSFIKGHLNVHCAMKIYYQYQSQPILDPLDMTEAHDILKKITVPGKLLQQYQFILQQFAINPISTTLTDLKQISESDQAFPKETEQALKITLTPKNRILKQILQGYDKSLGAKSSFIAMKDGLLSQQESEKHMGLCAYLVLERENSECQKLVSLKDDLRKCIPDFNQKLEDELTKQMIEIIDEKFVQLKQRIESKDYQDLIKDLKLLDPSELTPTTQSALHYYKKCSSFIVEFCETLGKQSKECLIDLTKNLPQSNEDFSRTLNSFKKSVDDELYFSQILQSVEQKLQELKIEKSQMVSSQIFQMKNSVVKDFAKEVSAFIGSMSDIPIEDQKWTQTLLKLCILSQKFPEEFDSLRKRLLEQYSDRIQYDLNKKYREIIEDNNILRNYEEEKREDAARPALAFQLLMRSISQIRTNVEILLKDQIATSLKELEKNVNDNISAISGSISRDLMELLEQQAPLILIGKDSSFQSVDKTSPEIQSFQTSLNLIGQFAQSAHESKVQEISQNLRSLLEGIVKNSQIIIEACAEKFVSYLDSLVSTDAKILETTNIRLVYKEILTLRQVSQVKNASSKIFLNLQKRVQEIMRNHSISIKELVKKLDQGYYSQKGDKKEFFEKIEQQVNEFKYFSEILEIDVQTQESIKKSILTTFQTFISNLYNNIELDYVKDPRKWEKMSNVADIFDDYVKINEIFAYFDIYQNKSQDKKDESSFSRAVFTAMDVILRSLSKPIHFMSSTKYQKFANYYKYLEIISKNKKLYIPDEEKQKLAEKMKDHIGNLIDKQIDQLLKTFEYYFRTYIFIESKERDQFVRPSPIQFIIEENKSDIKGLQDLAKQSQDQLINTACQQIRELVFVPYWLIRRQINDETSNKDIQDPLRDLLKRLSFKKITDVYKSFKKSLLQTFFYDFNIVQERLKYETEKESSLFYFKLKVVRELKPLDMYFDLTKEEVEQNEIQNSQANNHYKEFFDSMRHEIYEHQTMEIALIKLESALKSNVREESTMEFKQLYASREYKKLSESLKGSEKVELINIQMNDFIKDEVAQTLNHLKRNIQDFEIPGGEVKEICCLIFQLDAIFEFLSEYIEGEEIEEEIIAAIKYVQKVFDDSLKTTMQESDLFLFDQAIKGLHGIHILVKKMQQFYADSSQVKSHRKKRNSLKNFFGKMETIIEDSRIKINGQLGQALTDYLEIITSGKAQLEKILQNQGYSAAKIINDIDQLESKQSEWANTKTQVNQFVSAVKIKFNRALELIKIEAIKTSEKFTEVMEQIQNLQETLFYLPENHFSSLKIQIEAKLAASLRQNSIIQKNLIEDAIESQDAAAIKNAIIAHKNVIDDQYASVIREKLSKIIIPMCQEGQRIVCAKQVLPDKIFEFMSQQVPKIEYYMKDEKFQPYIHEDIYTDYKKLVKDNLINLQNYCLCYLQREIELGSLIHKFEKGEEINKDENLKLIIVDADDCLEIIDRINQVSTKRDVIECYDIRLKQFFKACGEHCIQLITQLTEAIRTNNSKQIIGRVNDIVNIEKFVSQSKFMKALDINYKEESKVNSEFVLAVRCLRDVEPKRQLYQWGEQRHIQLRDTDFTAKTNNKTGKQDRANNFGRFFENYKELEEVSKMVSVHDLFDFRGNKLRKHQEIAQLEVKNKVQNIKDSFKKALKENVAIEVIRNLFNKAEASKIDSQFEEINSGYLNLEIILEQYTFIDQVMKQEIKESLDEFKTQIDKRINMIYNQAKTLNSKIPETSEYIDDEILKEIVSILIEIQLMKGNFTKFKNDIQKIQDAIINEYDKIQEERNNRGRFDNLIRMLNANQWGSRIINDCSAFEGYNMKELARKLNIKSVDDVIKQIKGEDIIIKDEKIEVEDNFKEEQQGKHTAKQILLEKYKMFHELYQKKLKSLIFVKPDDNGDYPPIDLDSIVKEIKSIKMKKKTWDDDNIEKLPRLLSLIFTLWSLQKPELVHKQQKRDKIQDRDGKEELKESESQQKNLLDYLNQPHPAQILGIMRILGIGYAPNEQVNKGEEKQSGIIKFIGGLFGGSGEKKFRNNLVQIKTGEGKSVTLAVLSIIFALCDFDVRCACYSAYLSERDFKSFEAMFNLLGLNKNIVYNTFNQICEKEINKSGDLRKIILNLVLKQSEKVDIKPEDQARPQILLIDEVDVFFSESFFGNTYMPQAQIKGPEVEALTDYIWENKDKRLTLQKVLCTQQYQKVLALFQDKFKFLLEESVKQMLVDLLDVRNFQLGVQVKNMFIMDIIDGRIKYKVNDQWSSEVRDSYRTMFAYYYYYENHQLGKTKIQPWTIQNYKTIGINFTKLSFAEIPLSFTFLLGVTGTLDTLTHEQQNIMKNVYNFVSKTYAPSVYDIPKHLKKPEDMVDGLKEEILIMNQAQEDEHRMQVSNDKVEVVNEMKVKIIKGKSEWFKELAKRINELIITKNTKKDQQENQRAVIVFFQSQIILSEFLESEHLNQLKSYAILTDKLEDQERDQLVDNATMQGTITLSTSEFGRGTDFKYLGNALKNAGGLAVIQTFFTFDYSEEIQIRGRTRRQGATGSYEIIVSLEDLYLLLEKDKGFVDSLLSLDPRQIYSQLHIKGLQAYDMKQKAKMQQRTQLKSDHDKFISHLDIIKRYVNKKDSVNDDELQNIVTKLYELNACCNYEIIKNKTQRCIKTLVLIDATGSMGAFLENVRDTIMQYFEEVCKSLKQAKYDQDLFKIQIAFYRNYNDGENILKVSPWVGPKKKQTLQNFVNQEKASGGTNISVNEAMEIAFYHANQEIDNPSDGSEPVSLIFVIGDQPSNTKQQILRLKYKAPASVKESMTDEEAIKEYGYKEKWKESLQEKYGESTTWEHQLDRIKNFEDEKGFKIPVQSFYVSGGNKVNNQLEEFYSKLRVNNSLDDNGRLLNLKHKEKLVTSLCTYTIKMIGEKNPDGGNMEELLSLAGEMHKKQLAFA